MNTTGTVLSSAESAAIEAVREYALKSKGRTLPAIRALLKRYRLEHIDIDNAIRIILYGKRITVNFHPDSVVKGGKTVIESLLCEGEYHNQFVTGISNGHLSCRKDDLRDVWEKNIWRSNGFEASGEAQIRLRQHIRLSRRRIAQIRLMLFEH